MLLNRVEKSLSIIPINNTHPGLRGLTQMILGVLIIRNFYLR